MLEYFEFISLRNVTQYSEEIGTAGWELWVWNYLCCKKKTRFLRIKKYNKLLDDVGWDQRSSSTKKKLQFRQLNESPNKFNKIISVHLKFWSLLFSTFSHVQNVS